MNTPAERLASSTWRRQNSSWLAPTVLCCGFLTWGSFLYIGVRAKRRSWLVAAGLYAVGLAIGAALLSVFDDGNKETRSLGEEVGTWVILVLWIAGIIHGLIVNREWLKWLASQGPDTAWYLEGASTPPPPAPYPSSPTPDDLLRPTWTAPVAPQAPVTRPAPPSAPAPAPQPTNSGPVVDLNVASPSDLTSQLGIPADQAARVVAVRNQRGGFGSPDELMTFAGIEPHVYASFRHRLTTSPRQGRSEPPNRGRRLEL
jgi:hypothetical protein